MSKKYYPDLVREFYANISNKKGHPLDYSIIESQVWGRRIFVGDDSFVCWLKILVGSKKIDLKKAFIVLGDWNLGETLIRLNSKFKLHVRVAKW